MLVVLDTHAWIWWADGGRRLSRAAARSIDRAQARSGLWLSMISVWEIAKKVEKRRLVLDRPLDEWLDLALALPGLQVAELTRPIVVEGCRLPQPFLGDPADQLIVATARDRGATVVTKDERILTYPHVRAVW
jgi:PIN domain nuclease of toxin-antitoxin system